MLQLFRRSTGQVFFEGFDALVQKIDALFDTTASNQTPTLQRAGVVRAPRRSIGIENSFTTTKKGKRLLDRVHVRENGTENKLATHGDEVVGTVGQTVAAKSSNEGRTRRRAVAAGIFDSTERRLGIGRRYDARPGTRRFLEDRLDESLGFIESSLSEPDPRQGVASGLNQHVVGAEATDEVPQRRIEQVAGTVGIIRRKLSPREFDGRRHGRRMRGFKTRPKPFDRPPQIGQGFARTKTTSKKTPQPAIDMRPNGDLVAAEPGRRTLGFSPDVMRLGQTPLRLAKQGEVTEGATKSGMAITMSTTQARQRRSEILLGLGRVATRDGDSTEIDEAMRDIGVGRWLKCRPPLEFLSKKSMGIVATTVLQPNLREIVKQIRRVQRMNGRIRGDDEGLGVGRFGIWIVASGLVASQAREASKKT